ncbi:MAG TPA: metallophosphoesterase [Clostridia bacterium]|jgi:putative phosphoesterase|nr:metallophosphoesterase [Clostridia bacterium]HHY06539.1 metallophosphoesterase [Clostridia bacterium]
MQIGLVGDTHGSKEALAIICRVFTNVELLFHTGDHWQDGVYLEQEMGIPVLTVKGNCDYGSMSSELLLMIKNKKFFLTHGHAYRVKFRLNSLLARATELEADYCLFGHTHRPLLTQHKGIYLLNPGSLVWSRGKETYAGIILEYRENMFISRFMNIDRE